VRSLDRHAAEDGDRPGCGDCDRSCTRLGRAQFDHRDAGRRRSETGLQAIEDGDDRVQQEREEQQQRDDKNCAAQNGRLRCGEEDRGRRREAGQSGDQSPTHPDPPPVADVVLGRRRSTGGAPEDLSQRSQHTDTRGQQPGSRGDRNALPGHDSLRADRERKRQIARIRSKYSDREQVPERQSKERGQAAEHERVEQQRLHDVRARRAVGAQSPDQAPA
jgi:hypothetical protein